MKRALLATLWIGAVAAAVAIVLQTTGLLARPAAFFGKAIGLPPNEVVSFGNFLFVIVLSFAVAWTMLEVTQTWRRVGLLALLFLELIVAAWVWQAAGSSFPPLPAILAAGLATALACGFTATDAGRRRRATTRLFERRINQANLDRLTENGALELGEPLAREASLVFCEIANEGELIDELPAAVCAQLTREFNDLRERALPAGWRLPARRGWRRRPRSFWFSQRERAACARRGPCRARLPGQLPRGGGREAGFVRQDRPPHRPQLRCHRGDETGRFTAQ